MLVLTLAVLQVSASTCNKRTLFMFLCAFSAEAPKAVPVRNALARLVLSLNWMLLLACPGCFTGSLPEMLLPSWWLLALSAAR